MIELNNVSYAYDNGTVALDGVTVQFPRGTISAVLGESGSGKTTLLMCLGQFKKPHQGTIRLDDDDIYDIPEKTYRKKVGIVFQKLYLFPHLTILRNMMMAPMHVHQAAEKTVRDEAMTILARLGIADLADSYPNQISGGQAQRAAIARGLLLKPDYMLLDEPTSALDANTTDEFAKWLTSLRDATNFIIVTHDILFAETAANTGVYLSGGKVLDSGDVSTIIKHVRAGVVTEAQAPVAPPSN
jgi:ABC-type polar amino acid transport system ATPase subunit